MLARLPDVTAKPVTDRVRVRRAPHKGRYDRGTIDSVLDRGLIGHIAFVHDGQPCCIPMLYARVGDRIYVHGSRASRAMRALASGAPACLTVTLVHGLVLARSAFEHSANYESAVVFGRFDVVEDPDDRVAAFEAFTEKLLPGRWREVRPPNRKELKATTILALPIDEASAKLRFGPPDDDDSEDAALDTWAGVLPIVTSYGAPEPSPGLRPGIPPSSSITRIAG
jgi:nitroimidazol reductase NimA-like FMN-containing flavoprotein (pyridoxamine 5'-phosphate oxidase superfamily)